MRYTLVLIIGGLLLYLPSLFGPFLWDDEDFVYANSYVSEFRVDKFFTDSVSAGRNKNSNYFRPLQLTTYALTKSVAGFSPFVFHLVNVLTHLAATYFVLRFFRLLLKRLRMIPPSDKESPLPFLIALIFLVHPVQTEAVSYVSGLSDPLFVLFGFLSLITFLLKVERKNMIPLSILFFTLSVLSKETGLVFLPLLFCLNFVTSQEKSVKRNLLESIKSASPYLLITLCYLSYHFIFINSFDMKAAWGNTPYASSIIIRLLTFIQNLYVYTGLLLFPKDLFMERDATLVVQTSVMNLYLVGFVGINTIIAASLVKLKRLITPPYWQALLFSFTAFYLCFIPYTGVILINGIFYEHFLYLPLVFFFSFWILLASSLLPIGSKRVRYLLTTIVVVLILAFSLRNMLRQLEWNNDIRFYSQTLTYAPTSVRIINGLGMAYAQNNEFDKSIATYQKGVAINPSIPNLYHNLANIYATQGKIDLAEENYKKAIELDPKFSFSWQALASLYQKTGQEEKLTTLRKHFEVGSLD